MVFLAACNSNTEAKKVEVKPEDIQVVEQVDNNPQAYFSATGYSTGYRSIHGEVHH